jgi:hypothetical protein
MAETDLIQQLRDMAEWYRRNDVPAAQSKAAACHAGANAIAALQHAQERERQLAKYLTHTSDCECVRSKTMYGVTLGEGGRCTCGWRDLRNALGSCGDTVAPLPTADRNVSK